MSSKSKRRVTVDTGNAMPEDPDKRKPSVFERLGPGGQRKYSESYDAAGGSGDREREKKCRPFLLTGECPYGATCKYKHITLSSRKSKSREGEREGSPENLRLKLKGQQTGEKQHRDSDSETADKSGGRSRRDKDAELWARKDKETKIRSQVVVKKSSGNAGSDDSDVSNEENWFESLDYKKELELEQTRQQLQRALSQLEEEGGGDAVAAAQKKIAQGNPGSDSSPDIMRSNPGRRSSPHDKRSPSPSGRKKEKKKHRARSPVEHEKERKPASLDVATEKMKEHKKKYEEDDGGHKKHKKNKKEKRRSISPPPEPLRSKKREAEDLPRTQSSSSALERGASGLPPHSKRARSSSSSSSPPRSKDGKDKGQGKGKGKKKKSRKEAADDLPGKSKKWLSPLVKTLKVKKTKSSSSVADSKEAPDDERARRRSRSPQVSRRSHSREVADELASTSRSGNRDWDSSQQRGRSLEKQSKKGKGKRSRSPRGQSVDKGSSKRGEAKRDKYEPVEKDSKKGGGDERRKRPTTPPARQSELYSPSQLDRESPYREQSTGKGRQSERESQREDSRLGDRDSRRGDKYEGRPPSPPPEPSSTDRYGRRREGENLDQDRGRFESDRNRGDLREGRGQEADSERERGRRMDRFSREQAAQGRKLESGRDSSFDRQQEMRGASSRDQSRDGRDTSRADSRERRERDSGRNSEASKFGMGGFSGDQQRRSGQWEQGSRSSEWVLERGESSRDLGREGGRADDRGREGRGAASASGAGSGGRMYRDDSRDSLRSADRRSGRDVPVEGRPGDSQRTERGEGRSDRGDGRMERGEGRIERGRERGEGRGDRSLDRTESRGDRSLDRGDGRLDRDRTERGDRLDRTESRPDRMDRSESRVDRGDNRMDRGDRMDRAERPDSRMERGDRGERGDGRMDRRREQQVPSPFEQRGFRGGQEGPPGGNEGRGGVRGVDERSPVDTRNYDFGRRGGRDGGMGRPGERDREQAGMGVMPGRDRYNEGPAEFRQMRDERGLREEFQDANMLRDRRDQIERFDPMESRDGRRGGGRSFEEGREGRAPFDERMGRDRGPRRGDMYDFDQRSAAADNRNVADMSPVDPRQQQRRTLLPTPGEEQAQPQRGGYGPERDARDAARDGRDDRRRRDAREGEFGMEPDRAGRGGGRDVSRDGRDPAWDRNRDRDAGKDPRDLGRDPSRDAPRDLGRPVDSRREAEVDRGRDRGRDDDRGRGKGPDSTSGQNVDSSRRGGDREGDRERDRDDARSTRSADDSRRGGVDASGRPGAPRDGRDRDVQSDGKRSPGRGRGRERSPLAFARSSSADRRQPKRARSLSPKQRKLTPPAPSSKDTSDKLRSPTGKSRLSAERRGDSDVPQSPSFKGGRRARSRSPTGAKRKMEDRSRSPGGSRTKDDTKSPVAKRPRDESRSPGRRSSRQPSPAGSHHSRSSHTSIERRRRPGSSHHDRDGRFVSQNRDSPARRDRDRERERERDRDGRMERGGGDAREDADRKRGRSPAWSRDGGDRKRWRGPEGRPGEMPEMWGDMGEMDIVRQGVPIPVMSPRLPPELIHIEPVPMPQPDMPKMSPVPLASPFGPPMGRRPPPDAWGPRPDEINRVDMGPMGGPEEMPFPGNHEVPPDDNNKDAALGKMLDDDEYEAISSDEGDFDAEEDKQGQNIVSILDIDWASLAKAPAPKLASGSLLKQFHPANIFHEIGVSRALAGDTLFDKVKAICEKGVEVETDKKESEENAEKAPPVKVDTKLHSDVPILHMASVRQKRERSNLLRNLGPFRRALCARRDLEIRRQLCKLDKVYEQPAVFPTNVMDADLCKLSIQLFRQGRDFSERKDSECESKWT